MDVAFPKAIILGTCYFTFHYALISYLHQSMNSLFLILIWSFHLEPNEFDSSRLRQFHRYQLRPAYRSHGFTFQNNRCTLELNSIFKMSKLGFHLQTYRFQFCLQSILNTAFGKVVAKN